MERIWQWAWDRYKSRYSWAAWLLTFLLAYPVYVAWSLSIVAFEKSDRYLAAAAVTVVVVLAYLFTVVIPGGKDPPASLSVGPPAKTLTERPHCVPPTTMAAN